MIGYHTGMIPVKFFVISSSMYCYFVGSFPAPLHLSHWLSEIHPTVPLHEVMPECLYQMIQQDSQSSCLQFLFSMLFFTFHVLAVPNLGLFLHSTGVFHEAFTIFLEPLRGGF